jgi:arsenite-transporting ATPase
LLFLTAEYPDDQKTTLSTEVSSTFMGMNQFHSLQLAMFSGKGGVGKTTLACSFARNWASHYPDQDILLISTDPAHSLGDVLQMLVEDIPSPMPDIPNLKVRALNADRLLQRFREQYGKVLETLVERGSFVEGGDLTPVWDLSWPGLDELMGILEIQRILREQDADRVVVDMAPSGHTLNLFELMDFLDNLLDALQLFQEKHRVVSQTFTGRYTEDEADRFLSTMKSDLAAGRELLQDAIRTACLVVGIAEPMSLMESQRFIAALHTLQIPVGGIFVNHIQMQADENSQVNATTMAQRIHAEQVEMLNRFLTLAETLPVFIIPEQAREPVGDRALDALMATIQPYQVAQAQESQDFIVIWPDKQEPGFHDFIAEGRRLILIGGKGGVGKTTVAAAIAWGMAHHHSDRKIRAISIDPAHSLGDALGTPLSHDPIQITPNFSAQEVNADRVLDQFRDDYLWELAEMMSGDRQDENMQIAYGPQAWRQIVAQALPGIDEMLSLITVIDLLEQGKQDLIILDTAPTGHLLRFLEMPTALGDWLAWIFKLWIKYQDVVGRTEFMGRLRTLRKRVMHAQQILKDPSHTEFIGVLQAQSAIVAEAARLTKSITELGIRQHYVVHNRFQTGQSFPTEAFADQTIVRLPILPRAIAPLEQIQGAANLVF